MVDNNTVIEGGLKFRDGKKWKCRWAVMRKLSPVADCLHLQLYRDSKDRFKQGQTKASLSLQTFLGVQSGFTLDKESNTIAIICQEVTVVLAFDTRERLIQWQVKIAHNLGEDEQFLVQVSSAPVRAKLSAGPARLHVLEHQFCMAVGLPPRLVGCWRISQLRRYGVVDSKFCFEGGSRCGRGEGLYVLVTDQAEEISTTFRLAAEGKLASRKRPSSRNASDSPKKSAHSCLSDVTGLAVDALQPPPLGLAGDLAAEEDFCECECGRPDWQGRGEDFADTSSVSEFPDSQNKESNAWMSGEAAIERCASCISKLGALSRSSTATATIAASPIASLAAAPTPTPTPSWTMEHWAVVGAASDHWDSHGERSECFAPARPPKPDHLSSPGQPRSRQGSPNSSPKKRQNIPPTASACACNLTVNPYDNYDVPKGPQGQSCQKENNLHSNQNSGTLDLDYYDTPKNIKESCMNEFGNYDTPPPPHRDRRQMCTTLHKNQLLTRVLVDHDELQVMCPCRRLVCWSDSWMLLPYCRRGNGRDRTPPPLHKRASEFRSQVPTEKHCSVYATVDKSKKIKNRLLQENLPSSTSIDAKFPTETIINNQPLCENDVKRASQGISKEHHELETDSNQVSDVPKNYMNFDFLQSLQFYENSKAMMQKAAGKTDSSQTVDKCQDSPTVKICTKCRHECKPPKQNPNDKQDDYLMMEPSVLESSSKSSGDSLASCSSKYVPGYIPMHPIGGTSYINNQDLLKLRMCQQMLQVSERATSSPSLNDSTSDSFRRRSDTDTHRPGISTVFGINQSVSASNTPYLRRRILGCVHEMVEYDGSTLLSRQRSFSSANSSKRPVERLSDETIEVHKNIRDPTNSPRESRKLIKKSVEFDVTDVSVTAEEISNFDEKEPIRNKPPEDKGENQYENVERPKLDSVEPTVHIRRSPSAPSKSSHNRDSSSSNDSGVSSCSLKKIQADFVEIDAQITSQPPGRRYTYTRGDKSLVCECSHPTVPRKSKSTDPMQDLTFQMQRVELPLKSSSAEAEVPICNPKREPKGCVSPGAGVPYMDSRSTSSGTSDMSDYCETLSLSSYSSTDTPDSLHFGHHVVSTMKPRSGKEYHKIDRNILDEGSKKNQPALVEAAKEDAS